MQKNITKRLIYTRILSAFMAVYLLLMAGFTFFLIDREKKITMMEVGTSAGYINNQVTKVLEGYVDSENQLQDMVEVRKELMRQHTFLTHSGTEMAVFTGDYELLFNTNGYWVCSYTGRVEGTTHHTEYAYLNLGDWFSAKEIKELEDYLYAEPRVKKTGDLSGYSLSLEGFWLENEMVIPDTIRVVPMYASRLDDAGNVTSASGNHDDDNVIYSSGCQGNKDLPYFEHGGIRRQIHPYQDPQIQVELREIVMDKEKLKTAVQDIISPPGEKVGGRTNFLTYRYYLVMPYQNTVHMPSEEEPYSEFWTALARDVDIWDRCSSTLIFVWAACLIIFLAVAFILARQTYKTYREREEMEEQRREMTNALAHDLKTPLSIISGYAQNLQENVHTEKREHYASHIQANVERMDRIIRGILEMARLESDSLPMKREELSLKEASNEVFDRYRQMCQEKSLTVAIEGETVIKADHAMMVRVIDNFFVNALENTPDGGSIDISICDDLFEIYNSGSHIAEDRLNEIWLPFKKADLARSHSRGTGLGLAIARTILELHGFSYGALNRDDGVVFWFKFR